MNKILLLKISISLAVVCAIGATYYAISTGQEMRQRAAAQFNAEITAALKNSACQPEAAYRSKCINQSNHRNGSPDKNFVPLGTTVGQ